MNLARHDRSCPSPQTNDTNPACLSLLLPNHEIKTTKKHPTHPLPQRPLPNLSLRCLQDTERNCQQAEQAAALPLTPLKYPLSSN